MIEKLCEVCTILFTAASESSRFCSMACRSQKKRRKRRGRVEKECRRCKAEFSVPASHAERQRYCSKACRVDPVSRFWDNVEKTDVGCWIWIGTKAGAGYGALKVNNVMVSAHRLSWTLHFGEELHRKTFLCHRCDNPLCVNPAHLFKGNAAINMADRDAKDRQAKGEKVGVSKLTVPQVTEIKKLLSQGVVQKEIAQAFGVSQRNVSVISQGTTWKHVPWPE